jgi:hypothetical protein
MLSVVQDADAGVIGHAAGAASYEQEAHQRPELLHDPEPAAAEEGAQALGGGSGIARRLCGSRYLPGRTTCEWIGPRIVGACAAIIIVVCQPHPQAHDYHHQQQQRQRSARCV